MYDVYQMNVEAHDPESSRYLPRIADGLLGSQLGAMGAVLVEGVKGCGKTRTARQITASEALFDVDPNLVRSVELDPAIALTGEVPRLLDEWQRAPRLWDAVRRAVDDRGRPGQFILTGSATPDDSVPRHTGAGRFGILKMRTMTLSEKLAASPPVSTAALLRGTRPSPAQGGLGFRDYVHHIAVGGWPQLVGAKEDAARIFLDGYLAIIAEHDIDVVSGARRNPRLVRRFLHAYAQLVSHPAKMSSILDRALDSEDEDEEKASLSRQSATVYLEALRRMMIVDEMPAWEPSVRSSKRLTVTPKRHLADPSLATALLNMSTGRMQTDLKTTGFLFESLAAHDLRIYAEAVGAEVFHYREQDGRLEVDYVLETPDGDWVGVEVKLGESEIDRAADSLNALAGRVKRPPMALAVLTATSLAYTRDDGIHVIPLACLGP